MPRAGLTPQVVIAEAERMVEESGLDAVTLAGLAARLGVRQPSLYKHIDGVTDLRQALAMRAAHDLNAALGRAAVGRARGEAVMAMADAHRRWALAHPFRYQLSQAQPAKGDVEHEKVAAGYLETLGAVLSGFGLTDADAIDAIRGLRAAVHGFVSLELAGGFALPFDIDRSFHRMVAALVDSLERWQTAS
jgi:AcrR family transcriptional regulator